MCDVVPWEVRCETLNAGTYKLTLENLNATLETAKKCGENVRALLLTSPHNPLGTLYTKEELIQFHAWCVENSLHLICDEIYALSVYKPGETFVSILEAVPDLGSNVHVVYGMSKDFSMSGFRVGCLYTLNEGVRQAFSNLGYFHGVSNDTQFCLGTMLMDEDFVDTYLEQNKKRLLENYRALTKALDKIKVPYVKASAGLFLWLDLTFYVKKITSKTKPCDSNDHFEQVLMKKFYDAGVFLTPGTAFHGKEPGYFRLCFAWVDVASLHVAVERMGSVLETLR